MEVIIMPWVRFIKRFDFWVKPKVVLSYKADREYLVKAICAEQAVKNGSAVLIERPEKKKDVHRQS
jgi:hypothetical protein